MATLQAFLLQLCSDFLASMVVSGLFEKYVQESRGNDGFIGYQEEESIRTLR